MQDTHTLETPTVHDEQPVRAERDVSESRHAAAIEAAYILEALRK